MTSQFRARVRALIALILTAPFCTVVPAATEAQITLDGSMGPKVSLSGPDYVIDSSLGQTRGNNLFHSFGQFNVRTLESTIESATFTGPSGIANVVGRVTGGQQSLINGLLSSTIAGANLFLLNPAGVLFGPNASLDVQGSFHVTTADYLKMADGSMFHADLGKTSVLTTAPPAAFGFLSSSPAAIEMQRSLLRIIEGRGKTLSVVGGDVRIDGGGSGLGSLLAFNGVVEIASVASAGEAGMTPGGLEVGSFPRLGAVSLVNGARVVADDLSREGAGTVRIRAGTLVVDRADITAITRGNLDGARIGIDILVRNEAMVRNVSNIVTSTQRRGRAGDVRVSAGTLRLDDSNLLTSSIRGTGSAGDVMVEAGQVTLTRGGRIVTRPIGPGRAGSVTIKAGSVTVSGSNGLEASQILSSSSVTPDNAGPITITAGSVTLDDGGSVQAETLGGGRGGDIALRVGDMTLAGGGRVATSSQRTASGAAGDIEMIAGGLLSASGPSSGFFSNTEGEGSGGSVTLRAHEVRLSDGAAISAKSTASGPAGAISLGANAVTLTGGAQITTSSEPSVPGLAGSAGSVTVTTTDLVSISGANSGLISNTQGSGAGGNITLQVGRIQLADGAAISAKSSGTGNAGNITFSAGNTFESFASRVTTEATKADGGNITVTAPSLVHLVDSQITASVQGGAGNGGNITIDPQAVVLKESQITANAFGGNGGNIQITAGVFLADLTSVVSASSTLGVSGTVNIQAPLKEIGGTLTLPEELVSASTLLRAACGARFQQGPYSSLVVARRAGTPLEPGGFLPSPPEPGLFLTVSTKPGSIWVDGDALGRELWAFEEAKEGLPCDDQ